MNILDEITIDFDLDSKILCATPAKLKLRNKTLEGINFNLNDERSPLPALMLAKKMRELEVNAEITGTNIENGEMSGENIDNQSRMLRVPKENKDLLEDRGRELIEIIRNAAEINLDETPVVENVKVDEIPTVAPIAEDLQYNVEQGDEGLVAKVESTKEETKVPTIEEIREKIIPSIPTQEVNTNGLDKGKTDEMFKETSILKQEIDELKQQEQKTQEILAKRKDELQNEVNMGNELDKTYAEKQMKVAELQKMCFDAINKQKTLLTDMKNGVIERNKANEQEIQEITNKTALQQEENARKLEQISEEDKKIIEFQQLYSSVQEPENFGNYQEEPTAHRRVA